MDYDGNDFQGQNLHLAGEGSSKLSPVLHPYSLPKFDFDDSLQGHLRFDSLVENEVFLGIPSQEDNHWIEDFSRGSSGIEFSSSAAESCSISRRNNVWSEATSSESVEMLLKSVGQEEIVHGKTIIEESDVCHELGSLTEQMEHIQDEKMKDVMDSDPPLPSNELLEHLSSLNDAEGTSQTREAEISTYGSSCRLDPHASRETCVVFVTGNNAGVNRKHNNDNYIEVDTSVNKSLDNRLKKDSYGSGMQIDDIGSSSQDNAASLEVLNNQENENQVSDGSFETANCLLTDIGEVVGEHHVLSKEVDTDDSILKGIAFEPGIHNLENQPCSSSKVEPIEQHTVEAGTSNFEKPSSLPLKGDCNLQIVEGCNDNLCSTDPDKGTCEPGDLSNSTVIHQRFRGNMHEDLPVGDSNLEGCAIEISNIKGGISVISELKMDQSIYGENSSVEGKGHLLGSHHQLDCEAPVIGNKVNDGHGDGSSSNYVGDRSSLTVACYLTDFDGKKHTIENLKGADDASGVHKEGLNADDCLSYPMVAGSMQTYKGNLFLNPNEVHYDQAVSLNEKEKAKLTNDTSNMEWDNVESLGSDKKVEPPSQGEGMKENNVVGHGSECDITARIEPASNVTLENTNLASLDTLASIPLLSGTGATEDKVTDHLDKNKKTEDEALTEANLLSSNESSEMASKLGPVDQSLPAVEACNLSSGSEQAGELVHETVGQSSPMGQTSSIVSQSGHAVTANEISENSSNKLQACPTLCDLTAKQEDGAGVVVVPGNHEAGKNHEVASSKVEDSDKRNCGKLKSEKDKKDGVKESMGRNVPFSEVILPLTPQNVSGNDYTKDERSFTFEVHPSAGISERETSKDVQSFPTTQSCKISSIVKGSPSAPGVGQMDPKMISEVSHGSSRGRDGEIAHRGSKGTAERKTRRSSGKATGKENAKKGNMKEATPSRQTERRDDSCSVSINLSGTTPLGQFGGLKAYGNVERSGTIPCGVVSIPTPNLPDLNTSAPSSALFQQPFTDLQQVQLRAQIFVYGSLIQGAAPDEACMISAFGASDGGRTVWEAVWRACVGRLQGQKSHPNISENLVQLRSGARPPDQSGKQGALQSKVLPSPVGQATSKATPSPISNSAIALSSPLWNISTPCDSLQSVGMPRSGLLDHHQTSPPLHSLQTPPARSFVGHTTSWLSQAPFPRPWVTPQTSVFDSSARFSVLPMTEAVKLTPLKESFAPFSSGTKHASHSKVVHSTGPSVFAGTPSLPDIKKVTVSSGQNSADPKARKRKKATVSEDNARISLLAQTRAESVSVPLVTSHLSTSVVVSTPACFVSKGNASTIVTALSPSFSTDHPKIGEQNAQKKATLSVDTFSKVEEAKRVAEDAAALAAAAVSQSQNVWSQLDKQRSSGVVPDVEAKLASAAVAIAAAASVAKAAAAAANIASNAALQAKLMADEALISTLTSNSAQSHAGSLSGVVNLGKATPASILKGEDGSNSSSSIIVVAREAARRRVEAASAASKHAENLDAIVKAAELAAEAVSQAGKIVAMADSFPLNELVEAGPERYWRVPQVPPEQGVMMNNGDRERSKVDSIEDLNASGSHAKEGPLHEAITTKSDLSPLSKEVSRETLEDHMRAVDGISSTFTSSEKDLGGQKNDRASDLAKTIGVVPESEIGSRSASITALDEYEKGVGILKENNIKAGCLVEVHKDGDQFKAAWYSAKVLSLKDGKAFVIYLDLQSDNGSRQLKEWVALEGEGNIVPQIRIDRRVTTIRSEGARKRRRVARGDYVWSVGDRVDAWIQDCWREGVVTEKNEKDDTALTVHFPAEGEISVVRAWHLRPTLIWKNGEWIEGSSSREKDPLSQGDTPQEKRLKLAHPAIEGREKNNISEDIELVESEKPAESRLLPLSANEKIFNVGKNTRNENKPALGTVRSGLQKEGLRVIFGVPKPGKKRKFMEVSKHYVAERSRKTAEPSDSIKLANYLMPQGSGSRGWKNTKIDAKDKQPAESKPKVLKSGKLLCVSGRTVPQKDKFLNSAVSAQNQSTGTDHVIKDSVSTDKNESGQHNLTESESFSNTDGAAEGSVSFSSLALPSDAHSKKISTSKAKSERVNKGTLVSTGKLPKVEVKGKLNSGNPGKSIPEVAERRRSNRRIQPTSRLLEGLQSSLMISKIPAVSHDKSHRSQNRGTSKGNNHG